MDNLKITIDHLKNYLGTGLKFDRVYTYRNGNSEKGFSSIDDPAVMYLIMCDSYDSLNPICYHLSDLDKFIPELGFVPIEWFENQYYTLSLHKEAERLIEWEGHNWLNQMSFLLVTHLFEWHFWPFGDEYFEQGLVIDKLKQ